MRCCNTAFKAIFLACLLAIFPFFAVYASEEMTSSEITEKSESLKAKEDYARQFASMVLAIVQDNKKNFDERKVVLRDAFSNSVDIDWIAKFVLGSGWARATDEQKKEYMALYRKFLTETYVANFAENPDKRIRDIKIFNVNENNDSDFTVHTEMQLADMEDIKVNYLVNDTAGHYRVRDIAIENVSLITTHRAEFSQLATAKGIDGVITELSRRLGTMKQQEAYYSDNGPKR